MDKYNLSDIFNDLNSESSVILPKSIKIKNIKDIDTISNTTSSFMPQKGGYSDATSSFMPQKGGYSDATSSFMPQKGGYLNGTKNKDINQLISMLSDTSYDNYTTNSTDTEQLKKKLLNIVQDGGNENSTILTIKNPQARALALAQLSPELKLLLDSQLLPPPQYSVEEEGNNYIPNFIKGIPNFIKGVPRKVILTYEETKKYNNLITDLYIKYSELNKLLNNKLLKNQAITKLKEEIASTKNLIDASPEQKSDIYENQIYANFKKQDAEPRKLKQQKRNDYSIINNNLLEAMALCTKVANHLKYEEYIKTQTIKK